jgi:cytochrome c-type biogenesis protein CcmH/NrfF
MTIVQEWVVWMGFMFGIFLVGMLWARKERRDRAKSMSQHRENETSAHLGTDLVDTNRQDL